MAFGQLPPTLKQIAFGDWGLAVRIYKRHLSQHGVCTCWSGWLGSPSPRLQVFRPKAKCSHSLDA